MYRIRKNLNISQCVLSQGVLQHSHCHAFLGHSWAIESVCLLIYWLFLAVGEFHNHSL